MNVRLRPPITHRLLGLITAVVVSTGIACGRISSGQIDQGQTVASAFLDEVRAGRIDPAWQGTTVEFKSLMGSDSLRDYARTHPALRTAAEFVTSHPVESAAGARLVEYQFQANPPVKGKAKTPPTLKTIRVMINLADDPPRVERLVSE